MITSIEGLLVTMAPNGFYPRAFRWQGRVLRVLSVDRISTSGMERRFRVRTSDRPLRAGAAHRCLSVARAA